MIDASLLLATAASSPPSFRGSSITSASNSSCFTDSEESESPSVCSSAATPYTQLDVSPFESINKESVPSDRATPESAPAGHNAPDQFSKAVAENLKATNAVQQSIPMRILLVDDNPLNLALLLRLLHRRFADKLDSEQPPIALTDATVALDLLKGTLPLSDAVSIATPQTVRRTMPESARAVAAANEINNLAPTFTHIMLDIHMPAISGLSLARRIRGLPLTAINRNAKLLACTTAVRDQEQRLYRSGGFDGLIEKPVRENTLRSFFDFLAEQDLQHSRSASPLLIEDRRPSSSCGDFTQLIARAGIEQEVMSTRSHGVFDGGGLSLRSSISPYKTGIDTSDENESASPAMFGDRTTRAMGLASAASDDSIESIKLGSAFVPTGVEDLPRSQRLARSKSLGADPAQNKSFFLALHITEPAIMPPYSAVIDLLESASGGQRANSPNQISCGNIENHVVDESIRSPHYVTQGFFLPQGDESTSAVTEHVTESDSFNTKAELRLSSQRPQLIARHLRQISAAPIDIRDLADVKREVDLDSFRLEGTYFDAANQVIRRVSGADENLTEEELAGQDGDDQSVVEVSEREEHALECGSAVAASTSHATSQLMHSTPKKASPRAGKTHYSLPSSGVASHFAYGAPPASSHLGPMVLDLERELALELKDAADNAEASGSGASSQLPRSMTGTVGEASSGRSLPVANDLSIGAHAVPPPSAEAQAESIASDAEVPGRNELAHGSLRRDSFGPVKFAKPATSKGRPRGLSLSPFRFSKAISMEKSSSLNGTVSPRTTTAAGEPPSSPSPASGKQTFARTGELCMRSLASFFVHGPSAMSRGGELEAEGRRAIDTLALTRMLLSSAVRPLSFSNSSRSLPCTPAEFVEDHQRLDYPGEGAVELSDDESDGKEELSGESGDHSDEEVFFPLRV
ncbi:unnamed protein product [Tilletia controversa]|nr:unnamed protein product [Tilletia controversa]CAD6971756.1 unnamed protein product [Tilletia controversa]